MHSSGKNVYMYIYRAMLWPQNLGLLSVCVVIADPGTGITFNGAY